jgi:FAD/FMN-containing dehydrogenase
VSEPIISNREIQQKLKPHGLAFPSGHCPQVKLSGYLLSGGMSWNQGVWGHGVESVEKIEMVTADGELITADKDHNQDYFWAARGAGPGLFRRLLALPPQTV